MRIWAIWDIHGCFNTFRKLISKIPKNDKIICLGDLVDKGLKSLEVVDFISKKKKITAFEIKSKKIIQQEYID